jgi:signal transduction histidine kinase
MDQLRIDFTLKAARDLRLPVVATKNYIEKLIYGEFGHIQEFQKDSLKIILRNLKQAENLINLILLYSEIYSKKFALDVHKANINQIIADALKEEILIMGNKNINFIFDSSKEVYIEIDKYKFKQMILNLISNAIKFTEKGSIKISVTESPDDVEIIIRDTGVGIPKEKLNNLFDHYKELEKSFSSDLLRSGLGLAIVKAIVVLHNGSISVDSEINSGTTFVISLPKVQGVQSIKSG